jgi:hypothetical protein
MSRRCDHDFDRVGRAFKECPGAANVLCFELGDILIALVLFFLFNRDKNNHD